MVGLELNFLICLITFLIIVGREEGKLTDVSDEAEEYNAEVFCKSQSRLIKMEKSDEIMVVDAMLGSSVLLQCKYCEEKGSGIPRTWSRQKHIFTGNITEVELDMVDNNTNSSPFLTKDHSLVLRNLKEGDIGLYFCKTPCIDSPMKSFNYLIDLITKSSDEVRGSVKDFKNYTQFYIAEVNKIILSDDNATGIKVITEWSEWSECDSCFRKGWTRYRVGKCKVKFFFGLCNKSSTWDSFLTNSLVFSEEYNTEKPMYVESDVAEPKSVEENIRDLGLALSCRSMLLKTLYFDVYNLTYRVPDFVLSDKCNDPCKGGTHRSGPRYRKSIILATGAHLTLVCPDSTIDSEVRWEHDHKRLFPNEGTDYIFGSAEPRLYVDSFNTLYLFQVTEEESGNYTCFVDGLRMQEVRIIVLTRSLFFTKEFTKHLKCLGYVFVFCFFAYLLGIIITCIRSKSEEKMKKMCKDAKKLLDEKKNEDSDLSP